MYSWRAKSLRQGTPYETSELLFVTPNGPLSETKSRVHESASFVCLARAVWLLCSVRTLMKLAVMLWAIALAMTVFLVPQLLLILSLPKTKENPDYLQGLEPEAYPNSPPPKCHSVEGFYGL